MTRCSIAYGARSGTTGSRSRVPASSLAVSGGSDSVALAAICARARRGAGSASSPASRISTISCVPRPTPTSCSAARWPIDSDGRFIVDREDVADYARAPPPLHRARGADAPPRVLHRGARNASPPTSWRSVTHATIRPRLFCCGWCGAPARAVLPRCIRRMAPSSGRCSTAAATDLRAYSRRTGNLDLSKTRRTRTPSIARNRVRHELLPLLESRFNPNVVEVLASEADLARDELGVDFRRGR